MTCSIYHQTGHNSRGCRLGPMRDTTSQASTQQGHIPDLQPIRENTSQPSTQQSQSTMNNPSSLCQDSSKVRKLNTVTRGRGMGVGRGRGEVEGGRGRGRARGRGGVDYWLGIGRGTAGIGTCSGRGKANLGTGKGRGEANLEIGRGKGGANLRIGNGRGRVDVGVGRRIGHGTGSKPAQTAAVGKKRTRDMGFGIYIDPKSGRQVIDPGRLSQRVISKGQYMDASQDVELVFKLRGLKW